MPQVTDIQDGQIADLLAARGLSVVLMSADWDGNGIILRSILEGLAAEYGSVNFYVADYERSPRLARLFNLLSPPGIVFLREGELTQRLTGPVSAGRLGELIRSAA